VARVAGSRRLVLIPTGLLVAAPLHAAWRPGPDRVSRRYVLDDIDVVYLPTAAMAPATTTEPVGPQSEILVLQEPQPVSARPLNMASAEAAAVTGAFPNATVLSHERATKEAVLDALTTARLAHLICHGQSDPVSPLDSHLLLSGDERLRVADLLERDLSRLRLAVLSACESATASTHLPEAAVSFPAALLAAGAGGVIGSLWEAEDEATTLLMARSYQDLGATTGTGIDPAQALTQAQAWMRDSTNAEKATAFPDLVRPPTSGSRTTAGLWGAARTSLLQWAAFTYSGL
jgi:CHAT domain-containing protein